MWGSLISLKHMLMGILSDTMIRSIKLCIDGEDVQIFPSIFVNLIFAKTIHICHVDV